MRLERDFYKSYSNRIPGGHWQRIESGMTGLGIPDVNICRKGVEIWVENKFIRSGYVVKLSPFQVSWHLKRAFAGGKSWVMAGTWDGRIFLWRGRRAAEVKRDGLRCEPDHHWEGKIDWDEVGRVLFS